MTFAEEVVEMTKGMDLGYDRSIEESMLLDIVLKAKLIVNMDTASASEGRHD